METKIVNIVNEMAEYLDAAQLRMLQEVLLNNLSENVPEKKDISVAEAGGKISSPAELVDGFIEYQNRNYQGYLSLFEKYVETEVFRVRRDSVESSLDQILCHFSSFIKNRFSQEFEDVCQAE